MHACLNFLQKVFIFLKRFTEMKGINFHSLGLQRFSCMKSCGLALPSSDHKRCGIYSLGRVQTEVCSGEGAVRSLCPSRALACARVYHSCANTSTTGRSRTHVNHPARTLSRQVGGNEVAMATGTGAGPSGVPSSRARARAAAWRPALNAV